MSFDLPELYVGGGVELDVGDEKLSVSAAIDLKSDNDDARDRADREARIEWWSPRCMRIPFALNVTGAVGGSMAPITDLPQIGRKLEVKRIYVNLAAPVSQSLPNVELYLVAQPHMFNIVGVNPTDPLNLSSANIVASWKQSLPIIETWGKDELTVLPADNLFLVLWIGSGVSGFALAGNLQVVDRPANEYGDPGIVSRRS